MNLTLAYITSRKEPLIEYFFASLARQVTQEDQITIMAVDYFREEAGRHKVITDSFDALFRDWPKVQLQHVSCKPTVWQGKWQLPKEPWWAKSAYLNTSIILCETEWLAMCDDRCVLAPGWLDCVREAMAGNYAVCGSYEKRANMKVEGGEIVDPGELLGADTRSPGNYPFSSWYGGSGALPLEWCLAVQGFSEDLCDGLSSEDSQFGVCLRNSGFPVKYDSRMRLIEDRTPGQIDGALKRADKGEGRAAKSWDIVRAFQGKKTSQNSYDIRNLRDRVLINHERLEDIPTSASHFDWFDNQPISEMI